MGDDLIAGLVERYGTRGVFVDTNILLLYFVGSFDRMMVSRFKRTRQFDGDDFDLLVSLLGHFETIVTTPNVLSEVNSLSGQIGEPARTRYFGEFSRRIVTLDEHYVASSDAAQTPHFPRLGLTDAAIMLLSKGSYLVLTDDYVLHGFLEHQGVDVLNFNDLRASLL